MHVLLLYGPYIWRLTGFLSPCEVPGMYVRRGENDCFESVSPQVIFRGGMR